MEVIEFGSLTDAYRHALEGDEVDPFDAAGIGLQFRRKERHVGLRDDTGQLVASTGMVLTEVEIEGSRFPVVGFGGVIVGAAHRGRGLGRSVVQAALAKARQLGPRFAILFCHEDRAGLYRRLRFVEVLDRVLVQQPGGPALMPQRTRWTALDGAARWPRGEVTVHSLPF
jgi:predicted N-acetyltransferase YhbS